MLWSGSRIWKGLLLSLIFGRPSRSKITIEIQIRASYPSRAKNNFIKIFEIRSQKSSRSAEGSSRSSSDCPIVCGLLDFLVVSNPFVKCFFRKSGYRCNLVTYGPVTSKIVRLMSEKLSENQFTSYKFLN